ncbi:tigger transposable element-derived protein 4 [Carcharodon carcharias]|uniref:tigger transposable element-derived protein 4 n=1 Tax=Carcharodon carcharias TaxID=13397 RepID=UPI001B7E6E35|nr:tigger transposable element-derived protein 4 [Carcharodon carcharias]
MARNELSMKQKVELILQSEGKSQRQLAELFSIGKTQVQTILKRKAEILQAYEGNRDTARKRLCVRMEHGYLNLIMCRWFQHVQSQGVSVNGPIIQKAALHFAKELGINDFKASNGWLRSFRSRNNISFETFCDESPGVNQAWKSHCGTLGKLYTYTAPLQRAVQGCWLYLDLLRRWWQETKGESWRQEWTICCGYFNGCLKNRTDTEELVV